MTRTKSKLGTDKKVKSISRRKPKKGQISSTSTTLPWWGYPNVNSDFKKYKYNQSNELPLYIKFLLWTAIVSLVIWLFTLIGRFFYG